MYILKPVDAWRKDVYVGYTPDPVERIRCHNGLIKGGARATRRFQWEYLAIYKGFDSETHARSFESMVQQNRVSHYSEMIGVAEEMMKLQQHHNIERA